MSFLSPMMLWFGLLLLPLAAVYLLKVKPLRKQTTTFFLWDEIFEEKKASALFRRLQDFFSLLILALAVVLLVLAMAGPVVHTSQKPKNLLLVLDNSISMSATDDGKTRLEKAKEQMRQIVRAMSANTNAVLVTLGDRIDTKVNLTNNHRQLQEAIDSVVPSQMPSDISALRNMIAGAGLKEFRVIFATDGNVDGLEKLKDIECIDVAKKAGNIGIAAFDVVQPVGQNRVRTFFSFASSFEQPKEVDVMFCRNDEKTIVRVLSVSVKPGLETRGTIEADQDSPGGRWLLIVDSKDALPEDNIAYGIVPQPKTIKTGVSGKTGKYFFARCVEAFRQTGGLMELAKNPELVISQFAPVADVKRQIIFQPQGTGMLGKVTGKADIDDTAQVAEKNHPVMKMCDIESMDFAGIAPVELPQGAVVLARGLNSKQPLIYKVSDDDRTFYVLNFDPVASGFFFSASFPVMLYAMADDLVGMSKPRQITLRTGEKNASGKPADKSGFIGAGDDTQAVSVLWPFESLLKDELKGRTGKIDIPRGYPLAWWLCAAAILLIVLESVLYHRRKVG